MICLTYGFIARHASHEGSKNSTIVTGASTLPIIGECERTKVSVATCLAVIVSDSPCGVDWALVVVEVWLLFELVVVCCPQATNVAERASSVVTRVRVVFFMKNSL